MERDEYFEWGPLAKGAYMMLLWVTILVALLFREHLYWYVPMLIFLGVGLKTLLVRTGLARHLGLRYVLLRFLQFGLHVLRLFHQVGNTALHLVYLFYISVGCMEDRSSSPSNRTIKSCNLGSPSIA